MDKSLHERLADIQANLVAPKGQFNKFGNYKYRSCEDILSAVKPLLNGLVLTSTEEVIMVGNRYYIKATATITDGKDSISTTAFAREPEDRKGMDSAQVSGSTGSYSKKYSLNSLFAIDDQKDADATNDHGKAPTRAAKKPPAAVSPALAMEAQAPAKKPSLKACSEMLTSCGDMAELKDAWAEIYSHYNGTRYIEGLTKLKDDTKESINAGI